MDATFHGDGILTTAFSSGEDSISDVAIQPDSKIVVAGYAKRPTSNATTFALARYNANGSLDSTFHGDGKLTTNVRPDCICGDGAKALVVQPDGKIVVAGDSRYTDYNIGFYNAQFALVRYTPNGSLDATFDSDGKLTTSFTPGDGESYDHAKDLAQQADGKIVVSGVSGNYSALARYNADGSLDTSFDSDGKLTTSMAERYDEAYGLLVQDDDKIVVAGNTDSDVGPGADFGLARYNPDGALDASFGTGGIASTNFEGPLDSTRIDIAVDIAMQADGKLVLAGTSESDGTALGEVKTNFALARYQNDYQAPVVSPPAERLVPGPTVGEATVPVEITWRAINLQNGLARYELQQSINGGVFQA